MAYRIGIDIGGTKIASGLVDENYRILLKKTIPTLSERPYMEIIEDMAQMVRELISEAGIDSSEIAGIGIGCAGAPDRKNGTILYSNNLGWYNVPLAGELRKLLGIPVSIDNDANAAALGETLAGSAKGSSCVVMITLGTGVGGGIIIDGKIFAGSHHTGAEAGHHVIVSGGEPCTCGRKGCYEAYASTTALIRMAEKSARLHPESQLASSLKENGRLNGMLIFNAVHQGDETARKVLDEYLFYVSEGLVNLVNIFDPEKIVIGGGISAQGELILEPVRRRLAQDVFCKAVPLPEVVCATLGNDAGIIGAAYV